MLALFGSEDFLKIYLFSLLFIDIFRLKNPTVSFNVLFAILWLVRQFSCSVLSAPTPKFFDKVYIISNGLHKVFLGCKITLTMLWSLFKACSCIPVLIICYLSMYVIIFLLFKKLARIVTILLKMYESEVLHETYISQILASETTVE